MTFSAQFSFGLVAEGKIARWIMSAGYSVLPAYEIEKHQGKGPQIFSSSTELVAPDMLCFGEKIFWVEAKHKTVFTWYRKTSKWCTGVDLRHYLDYLKVQRITQIPVWIFFYHSSSTPSSSDLAYGCPAQCPTGLFGAKIDVLRDRESHRCLPINSKRAGHKGHGNSGMVYWEESAFEFYKESLPDSAIPACSP